MKFLNSKRISFFFFITHKYIPYVRIKFCIRKNARLMVEIKLALTKREIRYFC